MQAFRAAEVFNGSAFVGPATVVVDGDRIVGVELGHPDLPEGTPVTTYDGTLLPGLFDCHVHLVADATGPDSLERAASMSDEELDAVITASLADQVAGGVTTVRDLGDSGYRTLESRALPGLPRVVAAGPPLTVPDGHCHYLGGAAAGEAGVREAVREHAARGVDVLKVMASGGMLTPGTDVMGVQFTVEELAAAVAAGHEAGLPVLAHAHSLAGVWHAVRAGVDGIEHCTCLTPEGLRTPDELIEAVAAADVVVDPTLGFDMARIPPPDQLPQALRETMEQLGLDHESFLLARVEQLARMRTHGVRVVTGTDAGIGPVKPHGGAWRGVLDLLGADFSTEEALASATSLAADVCGLRDVTGRVTPGLAADLLVVAGDLSREPQALGRPVAVLVRGSLVE